MNRFLLPVAALVPLVALACQPSSNGAPSATSDPALAVAADVNGERPPIGDSKWTLATNAINRVLTSMPDDLNVGLMLFPSPGSGDCNVDPAPQVPIGPLSTTRTSIMSQLSGSPDGGGTPAIAAVEAAYRYIQPLPLPGHHGLLHPRPLARHAV